MAITSELIGKLGGADVEVIPVTGTVSNRATTLMYTADNPDGKLQLVVVSGDATPLSGSVSGSPQLQIGGLTGPGIVRNSTTALALETTETVGISIVSNTGSGTTTFSGMVYIIPLD